MASAPQPYSSFARRKLPVDRPTEDDVKFYEDHGWLVTGEILPSQLLDDAMYGVERYHAGERDFVLPIGGGYLDWRPEQGEALRLNDYVSLQNRELAALVRFESMGRFAAALTRSRTVRLFHDQLVVKPAGAADRDTVVGWHTDLSYWSTCSSANLVTAWIPLQDNTLEMGPLMVIDGSHRWAGTDSMKTFMDRDLPAVEAQHFPAGGCSDTVAMTLCRGQVSFHHSRTVHGSLANVSDRPRAALTVHIQDGENRYKEHVDVHGRRSLHINDLLCRSPADGQIDYTDPDFCPVLWAEEG